MGYFTRSKGRITKEMVISDIKSKATNDNITFSEYKSHSDSYSQGTLVKLFGSVSNAINAAGFKGGTYNKKIDKNDIIQDIKAVAYKLNLESMSVKVYCKHGKYSYTPISANFKNWKEACLEAGLQPHKAPSKKGFMPNWLKLHINSSKVESSLILEDILRVANELKSNSISKEDYELLGKYSSSTALKNFDYWKKACVAAGLEAHSPKHQYSEEQLIAHLKRFYNTFKFVPGRRDISNASGFPDDKAYYRCFDGLSWAEILLKAELISTNQHLCKDGHYYDSVQEMKIADLLFSNFINYQPHKKVCENRNWKCDFYLPDQNLWVEYDGLKEKRKSLKRYQEKLKYYKDNNYQLVELYEGDNIFEKLGLYLDKQKPEIRKISYNNAKEFLSRVHYLRTCPIANQYFGGFIQDKLVSVVALGKTANPSEKSLAINRIAWLVLVRNNRNFGSTFISLILRNLKRNGYRGRVVSWSDPRFHDGTLYKACNFELIETKQKSDYIYIDLDGNEYHKSKCRVPAGESESEYAQKIGLTRIKVPPKQKWSILV